MNIFPSLIRKELAHFDLSQKTEKLCVNQARQALHATGCDWLREEEEENDDDIFNVVDFVRNDVEERTCVYRQLG